MRCYSFISGWLKISNASSYIGLNSYNSACCTVWRPLGESVSTSFNQVKKRFDQLKKGPRNSCRISIPRYLSWDLIRFLWRVYVSLSSPSILSKNASPTIRYPAYRCLSARRLVNSVPACRCPRYLFYAVFCSFWSVRWPNWPRLPIPTAISRVSTKCRPLLHIPNETLLPDNFVLGIRAMLPDSDAGWTSSIRKSRTRSSLTNSSNGRRFLHKSFVPWN